MAEALPGTKFEWTQTMKDALTEACLVIEKNEIACKDQQSSLDFLQKLHEDKKDGDAVCLSELLSVSRTLRSLPYDLYDGPRYFHELIEGTGIYVPPPVVKPRNPELEARIQKFRAEAENRQYQKMVANITQTESVARIKESMHMKSTFSQAQVGINIIVTMGTCMATGWFIGAKMMENQTAGLVLGIALTVIVVAAEVILFIISGNRLENHLEKQKTVKPRSTILPEVPGVQNW